jgi:hypothetical protein
MTETGIRFSREVIEETLDLLGENYEDEESTQVLADRMFSVVHQNADPAVRDEVLRRAEARGYEIGRARALAMVRSNWAICPVAKATEEVPT